MRVVAVVCARGGSKRLPRKNLRHIGGVSLVAKAIWRASNAETVGHVYLSTDDEEIARRGYAAAMLDAPVEIIDRPAELATDEADHWDVWRHAAGEIGLVDGDVLVDVGATCPLATPEDVDGTVRALLNSELKTDAAIAVCAADRNPYYNLVEAYPNGRLHTPCGGAEYYRTQDAPEVWSITTAAYALRVSYLRSADHLLAGRVVRYEMPRERSVDVDTEHDLTVVRVLAAEANEGGG